jgi:hypothetical protein
MDEKPTVQMDSFSHDDQGEEAKTPATIPIDDMYQQQEWSAPPPPPLPPSSPAQQPVSPPPFAPPPPPPAQPAPAAAGATMIMGPAAPPPLLAWLAVAEGPGANRGQVFTLERETLVGRAAGQIMLSGDPHVSAQHAKVRLEPSEEDEEKQIFVLYDLASRNGTFAGDKEEYRDRQVYRHELKDGDYVLIGETTLVFKQV